MATIIAKGNLTADPQMHRTQAGNVVARFTIAENYQYLDRTTGEWVKTPPVFWRCEAWGALAEHVAASCTKGQRVIAEGTYINRAYSDSETGEQKVTGSIRVTDLGVSLRFDTVEARTSNKTA